MLKKLRLLLLALLVVALSVFFASRFKSYAPPALAVVGQLNVGAQTDLINYVRSKTIYQSDLYFGADQNAGILTSTGYVLIGQPVAVGTAVATSGFLLDANGRMRGTGVNIGTTATTYKLEVLDSAVSHGNAARFQGNVGIGYGVTANDVPLNVYQTAVGAPAVKINDSNNKPAGIGVNNGTMLFTTNNGATDNTQMTIKNDGNVGVGTTDALAKLYVSNGSNPGDIMSLRGGTSGYNMIFGLDDSQAYIYNNSSTRKLTFGTNSQKSGLVLDTNGNVGVGGATSPGAKLDVGGSVSMISNNSGNINIAPSGNTIFTQGNVGIGSATPGTRLEVMRTLVNEGGFAYTTNSKLYGTSTGTLNAAVRGDNQLGQTFSSGTNLGVWGNSSPVGQTTQSVNIGVLGIGGSGFGYALPGGTLAGIGIGVLGAGSNFDIYAPSGNPSYFAGNVGIGSSAPDASLDLGGGAISSNANGQRTYQNLYQYADSNNPDTGTLAIAMPQGWTNTMMRIRIVGYEYGAAGSWEVIVGGYNYQPSTTWVNTTAEIRGTAPFTQVRLGYNGSKMVILLGDTTTTWHYPKFTVAEFIAGHSNISGWGSGWSSSFLTSEASIANIVAPAIRMYMTTGGNLGIGGPTVLAHRLESNGTAVIGSLAAKVLNMGSWLCPNGGMEMGSSGQGAYCFVNGLSVDSSGNVGVGTPSSSYPLHLYKASSETGILTSWGGTNIYLSHGGWGIGAGKFGIGDGSTPTLTVDTVNDQVGINTSSPANGLDVRGNNPANMGTTGECCASTYTLGLSELTSSNNRLPSLQFHAGGFQEAFLRLNKDARIFEMGDNQGSGASLALLNGAGTRMITLIPGGASSMNVAITGASPTLTLTNSNSGTSTSNYIQFGNNATTNAGVIGVRSSDNTIPNSMFVLNRLAGSLTLGTNNLTRMTIDSTGGITIPEYANGGILYFGDANANINRQGTTVYFGTAWNVLRIYQTSFQGTFAYQVYSDKRVKKNIRPVANSMDILNHVNGVFFDWDYNNKYAKDIKLALSHKKNDIGVIAQDVEKVFPTAVSTDEKGYKSVAYENFIPLLIEAAKGHDKQLLSLQNEVQKQQMQLTELREKFNMSASGDLTINGEDVFKAGGEKVTDTGGFAKLTVGLFKAGTAQVKKLLVDGIDIVKKIAELEEKIAHLQQKLDNQDKKIQELEQKLNDISKK